MSNRVMMSCVLVLGLVLAASTASASNGTGMSWNFQATGYGTSIPVTALAMRDGLTWPVIFAPDTQSPTVKAISLYPVLNLETESLWHEIGHNLMSLDPNFPRLCAASSPTGEFAATCWYQAPYGSAVTGSSLSGFTPLTNTQVNGIDYDLVGNLVTLTPNTLSLSHISVLLDIDSSMPGTLGVIVCYEQSFRYYQTSPLLGGWSSKVLPIGTSASERRDLSLDALGRPHIAYVIVDDLYVTDFDVMSGNWTSTYIDDIIDSPKAAPIMAADSLGGVGLAWVSDDGALKYAYKNGIDPWATHVVKTGLSGQQTPGLAFDANDFPVISFVAGENQIWLAYDPVLPEPSTALLLLSGLLIVGFSRRRRG